MREDLTGFGLGGNKVRKLDFLIADAISKGYNTLITSHASSFSRNAAAAGRKFGLEVHVVMGSDANPFSLQFFQSVGAHLHTLRREVGGEIEMSEIELYKQVLKQLRESGKVVYELHPGGSNNVGALGYVKVFQEIIEYSLKSGVHFGNIILPSGSAGTQAGLVVGQILSDYQTIITGIAISQPQDIQEQRVAKLVTETLEMINGLAGADFQFQSSCIIVDDHYLGPGYAIPTDEGTAAVKSFVCNEGIILDDVYSGKAAAALINYCSVMKRFSESENILFIHTGGNGGLYY